MIKRTNAEAYCSEDISKIENYEQAVNDKTQTWHCHHRLEIQGQFRNSPALLKKCGLYYHVPAWQLIFLTKADHSKLHMLGNKFGLGKHPSEESRKKMSMSHSGEKNPMFGKRGEKSHLFGKRGYWFGKSGEKSCWFGKHHSEETRKKMSAGRIGRKWFTNGVDEIFQYECPNHGWVRGRIKTSKKTK